MALMPKRVKYRKSQKGRVKGNATRGNYVAFGDYGIQSLEPGRITAQTIEAGRVVASQAVKGGGKLYIRIFPHKSVKGKGEVEFWAAVVKPGTILYEVSGLSEEAARAVFARVAHKMPVTCRFVTRRPTV
jgi:large subunit ribosomal protein L16